MPNPRPGDVLSRLGTGRRAEAFGSSAVAMMFGHSHGGPCRQERSQVTVSQHLGPSHAAPGANEDHAHRHSDRPAVEPGRWTGVSNEITTVLVDQSGGQPGVHDDSLLFACPMGCILPVNLDKQNN